MRSFLALFLAVNALVANSQPVAPGQVFRWQQLELRAPTAVGWVLISRTSQSMVFMRRSDELARSEVATVSAFKLPEGLDQSGFVGWVSAAVQAELPSSRFRPVESKLGLFEQRGYTCVLHQSLSHDLKARRMPVENDAPLLHQHALYCRHPERSDTGFAAAFSTRGPGVDDTLPARARSFIDGVTPDQSAAR